MSYSICRISKIKKSGVTGIQIHDRREKNEVSHTNKDIDWSKTSENIDLLQQKEAFRTVVSNRISDLDLKRKPRSDATVMCQCLITSDSSFFEKMSKSEQIKYFEKSLDFISKRYGEKNLVSATIHFDEKTPHMHINFVPVTTDGRLSAKDLFSPNSLRTLQNDYNQYVREQGYDLQRGEIDSKTKHLEVEEYKVETKYKELELKKEAAFETLNLAQKEAEDMKGHVSILYDIKTSLEGKIKALEGYVLSLEEVNQINIKKPIIGGEHGMVKIPYQDLLDLQTTAKKIGHMENLLEQITRKEQEIKQVQKDLKKDQEDKLKALRIRAERAEKKANKVLSDVNKALEKCPKKVSEAFIQAYNDVGKEQKEQNILKRNDFGLDMH